MCYTAPDSTEIFCIHKAQWKQYKKLIAKYQACPENNFFTDAPITVKEVLLVIALMATGKAPGVVLVTYELLKALPKRMIKDMTNIINAVLDGMDPPQA